jgi:hypothetical protein
MTEECILPDDLLVKYQNGLVSCFSRCGMKPTKKQIKLIYDYIRFYHHNFLNSPEQSFDFIFKNEDLLKEYDISILEVSSNLLVNKRTVIYFKIRMLQIEALVLEYKLGFMYDGTCY